MMKGKTKFIFVLLVVMALMGASNALADYAVVTNTNSLNLRDGPGYSYEVIGAIPRGQLVEIGGETDGWYAVTVIGSNAVGFVDGAYLSFDTSGGIIAPTPGGGSDGVINDGNIINFAVVYNTNSLNLRDGPGYNYNVIGSAKRNAWIGVVGETNGWYSVKVISTGKTGYMDGAYLNFGASGGGGTSGSVGVVSNPKSTSFLNLREFPSLSAKVLGIYYNGAVCSILSAYDGWYQVSIDGMIGYFKSEYVSVSGTSGVSSATIVTPGSTSLNLRSGPSKSYAVLGRYYGGRAVTVLLKGTDYWKVSVDNRVGYMDSGFLSTSGGSGGSGGGSVPSVPTTNGYAVVSNPNAQSRLNLRQQPSTSAKVLAQYKNGIRFEVIAQGTTWCKVYGTASKRTGYMMTQYLTLYNLPATPTKIVTNGSSYVNLRSQPSKTTGSVLTRVTSGNSVIILTPGDEWTQVRYGNTTGYMMSYFLK